MNRTKLINQMIKEHGFQSYLEIGLGNGRNFSAIKCDTKVGVDPSINTDSDSFFETNKDKFDLIFIDGDHTSDQVERDIVNAWKVLNKDGLILLHDINPQTYESQLEPKVSSPWKGQVWRVFIGFMATYPKIKAYTTNDDSGIGWIWKSRHKVELGFIDRETTWEDFEANKNELLKIQ